MSTLAEEANGVPPAQRTSAPPAKRRLAQALRRLLRDKDFHSITTAEISRTAEANEALIVLKEGRMRGAGVLKIAE